MSLVLLIIGLLLFSGLILVHEWGHFIVARRNGVVVEEFSLFFGPRLFKHKTKNKWTFSIRSIPLGGYVKLKGEHDSDIVKGSFGAASLWAKSKIMAAGVVMNIVVGLVLLTALAAIGLPKLVPNQFTIASDTKTSKQEIIASYIEPHSPAAKAGLQAEDHLLAIGAAGKPLTNVTTSERLPELTKKLAGQAVDVRYVHQGQVRTGRATLLSNAVVAASLKTSNPKGNLGISPVDFTLQRSTWSAPVVAVGFAGQLTVLTFQGLGHAVGGVGSLVAGFFTHNNVARQNGQETASSQVSGPIGIFFILKDGSILGYQFMLFIIAIISLTLAMMNILPIPALDGGRLWITLIAHALKRPLSAAREEAINATGMAVLLAIIGLICWVDITRFF